LCRRLGGPQRWDGQGAENLTPTGFDLLTVQPVAMPSTLSRSIKKSILRFRGEIKERKHEKERK
jgi:hypothetical protein